MTTQWTGRWRIVETDLWDEDSIDLLEPAYIEFGAGRLGSMVVGALQAGVDYRIGQRDGISILEFSWIGDDDGHPASGRGWAQLEPDDAIRVKLFIHQGDDVVMSGIRTPPSRARVPAGKKAHPGPRRRRR
jgi:hypothetical protein